MFLLSKIIVKLFLREHFISTSIIFNNKQSRESVVLSEWVLGAANVLEDIQCISLFDILGKLKLLLFLLFLDLLFNELEIGSEDIASILVRVVDINYG
jgi:hypothetical protein